MWGLFSNISFLRIFVSLYQIMFFLTIKVKHVCGMRIEDHISNLLSGPGGSLETKYRLQRSLVHPLDQNKKIDFDWLKWLLN